MKKMREYSLGLYLLPLPGLSIVISLDLFDLLLFPFIHRIYFHDIFIKH